MNLPQKHLEETKKLVNALPVRKIANWLLTEGFFPEQYVLPPCFKVLKFTYKKNPYYDFTKKIPLSEIYEITFPKSQLTERTFGIINHKIYHDLVWQLMNNWDEIKKLLFSKQNTIYSYSFPIPLNNDNIGVLGTLRSGRMIYEFIEMSESDIVSEGHKYKFVVKSDIKNFYPSIYTHSIAWAINGKENARKDRNKYTLLGNKIDKLFQNANDGCTNGIAIGPAISDLITEVMLSVIDTDISKQLKNDNIDFIGVRFKDDYRFLCQTESDAKEILNIVQRNLKRFNLSISEEKSTISSLPEGLFREWTSEYHAYSLKHKHIIKYKSFENTFRKVLVIDKKHPNTGVIDKFLSELISKKYKLKLKLSSKEIYKVFSLLLMLKEKRSKSLPQILALTELLVSTYENETEVINNIFDSLNKLTEKKFKKEKSNVYDLIWLTYFLKSHRKLTFKWPNKIESYLLQSIKSNKQKFDLETTYCNLFNKIESPSKKILLAKHLAIFPKEEDE
ncbi:MAG: RNA-directed DNA polymerase [Flavobacteriales bacterium]|nr:RNA-directed DNA polymerase [Flavobacteriales bacterium]